MKIGQGQIHELYPFLRDPGQHVKGIAIYTIFKMMSLGYWLYSNYKALFCEHKVICSIKERQRGSIYRYIIHEIGFILRDEISIYQHLSIKAENRESFLSLPSQMGIKAKANHLEDIYQRGGGSLHVHGFKN